MWFLGELFHYGTQIFQKTVTASFHSNRRINLWLFPLRCAEPSMRWTLKGFNPVELDNSLCPSFILYYQRAVSSRLKHLIPTVHNLVTSRPSALHTVERAQIRDVTEAWCSKALYHEGLTKSQICSQCRMSVSRFHALRGFTQIYCQSKCRYITNSIKSCIYLIKKMWLVSHDLSEIICFW